MLPFSVIATVSALILAFLSSNATLRPLVSWWFGVISLLTFAVFAYDKKIAGRRRRRIPEHTLLLLSCLGGFPGAVLAIYGLRHKTQKRAFLTPFWISLIVFVLVWLISLKVIADS